MARCGIADGLELPDRADTVIVHTAFAAECELSTGRPMANARGPQILASPHSGDLAMKLVAITATVRAANECAWADPLAYRALAAHEQQDEARDRVCDVQCAENPAPSTIDLTAAGRRCLVDALDQAGSVQRALVLLRNATVALYNNPADQALRSAALRAVDKARGQLLSDGHLLPQVQPATPGSRFAEQAAALDLAEFSVHLPQLHREQQMWRMKAHWLAGNKAAQERTQVIEQERAQLRAQVAHR